MMKKILVLFAVMFSSFLVAASSSIDFRAALEWSYDTNSFSSPLPSGYDTASYPNGGEFLKRQNLGLHLSSDIFFTTSSRTGLSLFTSFSFPYHSASLIPIEGENGWEYEEKDSTNEQKTSFFLGFGPVFRYQTGRVEILLPIRLSIGSYDWFESGIIVGVSIEPSVNVFLNDDFFLSFAAVYDAHLMKFLFSLREIYDDGYIMLTAGAYCGIGVRFGG